MVVDHVEDHLDARRVKFLHHRAKACDTLRAEIARFGREKPDGVVAPVIAQTARNQKSVVEKAVNRQQFNRGDAQLLQMLYHGIRGEPLIAAAQSRRHAGMFAGQAFDMRLINQAVSKVAVDRAIGRGEKRRVRHHRFRDIGRTVNRAERQVLARGVRIIAQKRLVVDEHTAHLAGVRVQQQFVGVEAVALFGRIGTVRAKSIRRTRCYTRRIAMPDRPRGFRQGDARQLLAAVV